MNIIIVAFNGFNELDIFAPLTILGRVKETGWKVSVVAPTEHVTSMNGVEIKASGAFDEISAADAVLIGSGTRTLQFADDTALMNRLKLDPAKQLIAAQCSGTYMLGKLGLLDNAKVCTDMMTKPAVESLGLKVLDQPFTASGSVATAGGCLASQYLACWIIAKFHGIEAAKGALTGVAPVGEVDMYTERMARRVTPYL